MIVKKTVNALEKSVINDCDGVKASVINDGVSPEFRAFREYANRVRELQKVRGFLMKGGWWWRRLEPQLRQFVLCQVLRDDGMQYAHSEWAALPGELRTRISAESRRLVRVLDGCPWR